MPSPCRHLPLTQDTEPAACWPLLLPTADSPGVVGNVITAAPSGMEEAGVELVDLLWNPGQVSFSHWLPVFSLVCSCLFRKGPSMWHSTCPGMRVGTGGTEQGVPALGQAPAGLGICSLRSGSAQGCVLSLPGRGQRPSPLSHTPSLPPNSTPTSPYGISQLEKVPFPQWPAGSSPERSGNCWKQEIKIQG